MAYEVLDRPEIGRILFHPRPEYPGGGGQGPGIHVARIPVGDGCSVGCRIYVAQPDAPVILYFHGNGEIASDYDEIASLYAGIGVTLVVADFRGYGISDGEPRASALVGDAMAVYNGLGTLLTERGIAVSDLFVMGRSMGSVPAIEIASRVGEDISGLIVESGFSDTFGLIERIGYLQVPGVGEERDGFNNAGKIARVRVPVLIIHGDADQIIPVTDGLELHARCGAADKRLTRIPGAGHNDLMMHGLRPYFEGIHALVGGA
ncbi:MAG: alpha/beta hydrolase [Alphaproteobacteria bacterium]|nr:alpha/beta hydrolase [Alphaproteobacteria bacterium]MBF0129026.1 alpha/beta hydrolase [Alphaproteobacteria bacterium]